MGILNTLLGAQSAQDSTFTSREAFAGVLMATAAADGRITQREADHFFTIISRMQLFRGQTVAEYNAMAEKLMTQIREKGREHVLSKAAEGIPAELRETAFAVAVDAAFADGSIEKDELEALEEVKMAMEIHDNLAAKIVDVLQIKNRG